MNNISLYLNILGGMDFIYIYIYVDFIFIYIYELTKRNHDVIISSRYKYPVASREHSKYVWNEERVEWRHVEPVWWWW